MQLALADLWDSPDPAAWEAARQRYWAFVPPHRLELEEEMDRLDRAGLRDLNAWGWYGFLKDRYFRWKFTNGRDYTANTRQLQRHVNDGTLDELHEIMRALLEQEPVGIAEGLALATGIHGLGTAGASGLLSLLYPAMFGTVDRFVVLALGQLPSLPEAAVIQRMNPTGLRLKDAVVVIDIMQRKAQENNRRFGSATWTPRKVDQVLWACRQPMNPAVCHRAS